METQHGKITLSNYIETLPEYDESKLERVRLDSEEAQDKFIAYKFIKGTSHSRTGKSKEDLANQFALGVNSYS